jgi:hypothetical protein
MSQHNRRRADRPVVVSPWLWVILAVGAAMLGSLGAVFVAQAQGHKRLVAIEQKWMGESEAKEIASSLERDPRRRAELLEQAILATERARDAARETLLHLEAHPLIFGRAEKMDRTRARFAVISGMVETLKAMRKPS